MRAHDAWYDRTLFATALLCSVLACSGNVDRGRPAESATATPSPDSPPLQAPLASDATLVIQAPPAVVEALRAVADSFASREAIRVEFAAYAGVIDGTTLTYSPQADLVIVTGDLVPRLPADSSSWTLPFAAWPASRTDSIVPRVSTLDRDDARTKSRQPRRRQASGRRADSIQADSALRLALQRDSLRVSNARADSARVLVLTIPVRAPNSGVAERFVRYILAEGRVTLRRAGLELLPRLVMTGDAGSSGIRAVVDTVIPRSTSGGGDSVPPR